MLKRLGCLAAAGLLMVSLSACGGQMGQLETLEVPSSGVTESTAAPSGFEDNLAGLCKYMESNQAVIGERVEMSYKEIGAIGGFRYLFKFDGSTVQAEFYEFDLDNLDEKATACLDSVKEKGFFTLLGNDAPSILQGKYLMVYTDPDTDEANSAQREKVETLFQDFKP